MKSKIVITSVIAGISILFATAFAAENVGESVFKAKCASCHPNGGNVIKASKTIKGIEKPAKIIKQLRKGGGGMPSFDAKTITDADAKLLADYIIKTFKK